jgi:adenine C2-methylase RlmN of 23S rRNA A2503 and tRNA A37
MAIRSTVVDMEPTKHVPLQRPQQQQRKHSVFDGEILKSELKSIGVKPLHVLTIWTYVLRHVDTEAHDVPGLPHAAVEMVKEKFSTLTSHVLTQQTSADGSTTKLLIRLQVRLWQFRYNPSASYQE